MRRGIFPVAAQSQALRSVMSTLAMNARPMASTSASKFAVPMSSRGMFRRSTMSTMKHGLYCGAGEQAVMVSLTQAMRNYHNTTSLMEKKEGKNELAGYHEITDHKAEEDKEEEQPQSPFGADQGFGSLPFPAPFHTINVVMLLFLANIVIYLIMALSPSDDVRDFMVEHFTLSHENYHRIYPFFTSALYQEQILQLAIDCWLLFQFGQTMLGFLGNRRMAMFWAMTALGGGLIHVARQKFELYYGIDELEVRGRCYGPNPFILGLVGVEGLIFRHLNFIQQPPVPFLVLTAFVMVIDVWRIFTTKPEEHGAPTGGALVAYLFWLLPTRMLGLDKLTAAL